MAGEQRISVVRGKVVSVESKVERSPDGISYKSIININHPDDNPVRALLYPGPINLRSGDTVMAAIRMMEYVYDIEHGFLLKPSEREELRKIETPFKIVRFREGWPGQKDIMLETYLNEMAR